MKIKDLNWLDYSDATTRSNGIGASDASYLMDLSKWVDREKFRDGPHQLFEMKKGRHEIHQNRSMLWGKVLERHVVDIEYVDPPGYELFCPVTKSKTGFQPLPSHVVRHKEYGFIRCSPDRLVTMGGRVSWGLEIKTSWAYRDDWILEAYTPQLQWSMLATGVDKWELFWSMQARKPDHKYRNGSALVVADPIMQAEMLDRALKFWRCVETMDELPEDWNE